jgi:hypothetical protein
MSFYREKIIKNPTKTHVCEICSKDIQGEHIYRTGVWEGNFFSVREHTLCNQQINQMCVHCEEGRSYCCCDILDCYFELQEERRKSIEAKRA